MSGHHAIPLDAISRAEELARASWPRFEEDEELGEISERFGAVPAEDLQRVVRGLLCLMLPPASYGGSRRFEAGYLRFLALAWVMSPELLGERSEEAVADRLGIERQTFNVQVHAMRALLAGKHAAPAVAGPPQQPTRRGSARPRQSLVRVARNASSVSSGQRGGRW